MVVHANPTPPITRPVGTHLFPRRILEDGVGSGGQCYILHPSSVSSNTIYCQANYSDMSTPDPNFRWRIRSGVRLSCSSCHPRQSQPFPLRKASSLKDRRMMRTCCWDVYCISPLGIVRQRALLSSPAPRLPRYLSSCSSSYLHSLINLHWPNPPAVA